MYRYIGSKEHSMDIFSPHLEKIKGQKTQQPLQPLISQSFAQMTINTQIHQDIPQNNALSPIYQ
jgi:hypothetical protein